MVGFGTTVLLFLLIMALGASGVALALTAKEKAELAGYQGTLTIGSETVNESVVLAHIAEALIEAHTKIKVNVESGFNDSEALLHQAMLAKQIHMHPSWTGTQLTGVLEYTGPKMSREETFNYVKSQYEKRWNFTWTKPLGFNDTYVMIVTKETASKYNLKNDSDLAPYAGKWTLASDNSFPDRELDGYPGWRKLYGISFKTVAPMDYSLLYTAVAHGDAEVGVAYATDSRIKKMNLVALKDDKDFFPPYDGAYVVRMDVFQKYPLLRPLLEELSGKIDDATMMALNYQFDVEQKEPDDIARDFLVRIGLIGK